VKLWLVRHGRTEWSESGRHTGRTEVPLTDEGRAEARALAPALAQHKFALVLASPRARARQTAADAGFPDAEVEPNLAEWDYGAFEGLTITAIRERGHPDWTIFTGPVPGGETLAQVAARAAEVLARAERAPGDVLCFTHGHMGRLLAAVALGVDPAFGAHLALDPAHVGVVGHEHQVGVLRRWNFRP